MPTYKVTCPVDKLKELVLQEYPGYYNMSESGKLMAIEQFTPEVKTMYEYLEESEKE